MNVKNVAIALVLGSAFFLSACDDVSFDAREAWTKGSVLIVKNNCFLSKVEVQATLRRPNDNRVYTDTRIIDQLDKDEFGVLQLNASIPVGSVITVVAKRRDGDGNITNTEKYEVKFTGIDDIEVLELN